MSTTSPREATETQTSDLFSAAELSLTVVGDDEYTQHALPSSGTVTIGRNEDCEVVIADAKISRQHARLRIGDTITIEDLASANGTRVHNEQLRPNEPVAVAPEEAIGIGPYTLFLRRRAATTRPRRMWSHDYFEVRLEDECNRAARSQSSFAVAHVVLGRDLDEGKLREILGQRLRAIDVVGAYGPREYELLLIDTTREIAERIVDRLTAALSALNTSPSIALANYPKDGLSADRLLAHARAVSHGQSAATEERATDAPAPVIRDQRMQELYALADRVAKSEISVLILGETGVGKGVLAEEIHRRSPRAGARFVRLNCAAVPEHLLESELFGYARGAFTGADRKKLGLLEAAQGGTVFLDEIAEMPATMQAKLLHVLEDRVILPVGGLEPRTVDVRFVAACNRDLDRELAAGRFRGDLFYRLNGVSLTIPPLRERPREIEALALGFIDDVCARDARLPTPRLSPAALDLLRSYDWPGNVRELRNVVERAVLMCSGLTIELEHLPTRKMQTAMRGALAATSATRPDGAPAATPPSTPPPARPTVRMPFPVVPRGTQPDTGADDEPPGLTPPERQERARIVAALQEAGGNQSTAARALGISRRTMVNRMNAYDLPRPRKGRED